jgi:Subtilase family/Fibronectin type III domain
MVVCLVLTSHAADLPAWIQQARPADAPTLAIPAFARINESLRKNGSTKVIVRLVPPESLTGGFVIEGHLPNQSAVTIQRAYIARIQTRISNLLSRERSAAARRFDFIPFMALEVSAAEFQALAASRDIDLIEEDIPVPPTLFQSVSLAGGVSGIFNGFTGNGQTVAILDTGVDKTHPFLAGKVVAEGCYSTTYAPDSATPVCSSGSTAAGAGVPCTISGCEHGTHVAGITAGNGTANGTQFSGVARDAKIIAMQVFSRVDNATTCGGAAPCVLSYTSDQISALNRVYNLRGAYTISSVNMSLGGGSYTTNCDANASYTAEKTAIDTLRSAGIATVIASGNSSYTNAISAPACISTAISVGATDKTDVVASYSNSAAILNLLAPGSAIFSSIPGGSFEYLSGTSMATPHVTGAWAVLKSAKPSATVSEVLSALTATGKGVTDSRNSIVKPRIQLDAAVNALRPSAANYTLSVSKVGSGGGTIVSNPIYGISCGSACSSVLPVPQGNTVSLTAVPGVGSVFVGWNGGGCSGTVNPCIVASASGNMVVQAIFLPGTTIASEPFSGTSAPNGWTALDNLGGAGRNWSVGPPRCYSNNTGGSGNFAIAEASCITSVINVDSSLISPSYDLSRYAGGSLSFKTYFDYWNYSTADVDVSNDGGASWANVWRKGPGTNNTHYGTGTESVDIGAIAAGKANVKVRFRYYTNNAYGADWQFDSFSLYGGLISAPTATTGTASTLTGSSATLNGTINDNNATTAATFQYGQTTGYGGNVSAGTVVVGSGSSPVGAAISGLTCNSTYHFRLVGSNTAGTGNGSDQTFTTTACVPGAPTIISAYAGNARAIISFAPPASDGGSAITGFTVTSNSGQSVSGSVIPITVPNLNNGTAYTFSVTATNSAGTGTASAASASITPGVVRNSDFETTGYQTLQAAYNADTHTPEIQILAGAPVGSLKVDDSGAITIKGGFDAAFSASDGSPAILGPVTLKRGTTRMQNVVIRP